LNYSRLAIIEDPLPLALANIFKLENIAHKIAYSQNSNSNSSQSSSDEKRVTGSDKKIAIIDRQYQKLT